MSEMTASVAPAPASQLDAAAIERHGKLAARHVATLSNMAYALGVMADTWDEFDTYNAEWLREVAAAIGNVAAEMPRIPDGSAHSKRN